MFSYRNRVDRVVLVLVAVFGVGLSEAQAQRPLGGRPGGMMPGGVMPGGVMRGGMLPGGMLPGGMMPGGMLPGSMMPGGMMPGGMMPGGMMPGGMMPGGGQFPGGGQMPGGSASPSNSGYGGSAGGYGGYGDASGAYGGGRAEMSTALQDSGSSQRQGRRGLEMVLTASGVPNDEGQVRWPLGLRLLGSEEAEGLRRQTEGLFQMAAMQALLGQINPRLTRELTQAVNDVRGRLQKDNERNPLPWGVYQEADRFLSRLKKAPEFLGQALTTPAGGDGQQQTKAPSTQTPAAVQVALRDNYFEPRTITIAAGSTVHWANYSGHDHTATSDDGQWDSAKMDSGAVFSHTFARPGTYPYHCTFHPQEMLGVVVVE